MSNGHVHAGFRRILDDLARGLNIIGDEPPLRLPTPAEHWCNVIRELLDGMELAIVEADEIEGVPPVLAQVLMARLAMANDKLDLLQQEVNRHAPN